MFLDVVLKDNRDFLVRQTGMNIDISKYYACNDNGWRFLIPDGFKEGSRPTFTEVIYLELAEVFAKWDFNTIRAIALRETPKPAEERDDNISQRFIIIAAEKIHGFARSRRVGKDIVCFFHKGKQTLTQIKFNSYKLLGRLFKKRGERIIEEVERKTGKEPWGYLKELVEFFIELGNKLLRLWRKFIDAIRFRNATNSNNAINSKYYNSNNSITNSSQNTNTKSSLSKELEFARMLLNATPVTPEQPKRIVI